MAIINSNNDEENNLAAKEADIYRSGAGAINPATATADAPGASRTFDKIGSAAEFDDDDETVVRRNASAFEVNLGDGNSGNNSPLSWLVPLVIVFLLIAGGYAFCSHPAA